MLLDRCFPGQEQIGSYVVKKVNGLMFYFVRENFIKIYDSHLSSEFQNGFLMNDTSSARNKLTI